MYRRKVMATTVAVFAIGAAFAAQPTSVREDRRTGNGPQPAHWVPGTNGVIAAYESSMFPMAPPQ